MSPEQAKGEDVDSRTDTWSLGVIIYEMLTGQLPFKGDYDQAVMYAITSETPEPISGLRTGVPLELERIVNRCMSKDPRDRYQHTDDLLSELNKLEKDKGLEISKAKKQSKKKKKIATILIPISILILVLIITVYLLLQPSEIDNKGLSTSKWENSIAVLPFADLSPDKDQEYFCDGMTEQIISNLSRIMRLKVISRTSVMKYKDTEKTTPVIGKELNVAYVLEGSIRKFGKQIRITAQLIGTKDDFHLWSEDYDRELEHIFEVQDDISKLIASRLLSTLSLQEIHVIKPKKPANMEAYDHFLKGKYFLHKYERFRQISDLNKSEQMFKNAIEQDPSFAPSYAYLADLYGTLMYDKSDQKEKYLTLQEKYTQIAYELDSLSAVVLHKVGFLYWNKGIPEKRFTYLKKSIASDPNYFGANLSMGILLRNYGLPNHALIFFNKAAELNPVDTWVYAARATAYTQIGEFDKAEHEYQSAIGISPNDYYSLYYYTLLLIRLNRYEEAKQMFLKFKNSYPTEKDVKYCKSLLFAMQGDSLNAMRLFDQNGFHGYKQVDLYCILNNNNEAISLLNDLTQKQKSRRSRFMELTNLPLYDNLRSDPRFQEILEKHKEIYEENLEKYGDIDM
jgi:TolB-like protein/Tfp pilus assembly protein PilF